MIENENIIVFSSGDWRTGPTSPQHISNSFAEENKVLFIETFSSRWPYLNKEDIKRIRLRIWKWFRGIKERHIEHGLLYIYSPIILLVNSRISLFINRWIFLRIIRRLIKKLDMKNPILFFYLPPPLGVLGRLKEKAVIYYCTDEWLTYPGGENKIFMDSERRLIENADIVFAANKLLYQSRKPYARRIHQVYHGVDYDHFTKEFAKDAPLPADIKNIPKPIIAIIGNFAYWIDMDLIKLIAQRHREWSIVSIGPIDPDVDTKNLREMGNIYFFGQKNYSELPNYYRAIDVFIVPFLLNEHIRYCAPTRFYEHLSSGKPIITIDFPAAREIGGEALNIASDREDFINKIEEALKEKDISLIQKRKALARKNTWRSRVEEMSEIIEEILKGRK